MSYASNRIPLFANKYYTYLDLPLGNDDHDAVAHLNKVKTQKALLGESISPSQSYLYGLAHHSDEAEPHLCR